MIDVLTRVKSALWGSGEDAKPYACATCNTRFERQPHLCPECGSFQIDWLGWQDEY